MKNNPVLQYDNKGDRHGPESAEHDCVFDADPQDVEIMERLHNVYPESRRVRRRGHEAYCKPSKAKMHRVNGVVIIPFISGGRLLMGNFCIR